jgi:hypothetical protein
MTVDPYRITNYTRSVSELQEFLLFGIAVAGKKAMTIRDTLDRFLGGRLPGETPFEYIARLEGRDWLGGVLREVRLSPYGTRERGFAAAARLHDLGDVTVADLEQIPGIGPKTARFFVVHSRPNVRHAILDVHILAWLRERGYEAPRQTPQSPRQYKRLEDAFLAEADRRGMSPADLDLMIWTEKSTRA